MTINAVDTNRPARQGDVALVKIAALPKGLTETKRDEHDRIVLAYGEKSGHAHAIRDKGVCGFSLAGSEEVDYVLVGGSGPATLNHEYVTGGLAEHHPITMDPGAYQVVRQVEYTPEAIVRAVD